MNENLTMEVDEISLLPENNFSPSQLRDKLHDPFYLPMHADIERAFSNDEWKSFCFNYENPIFEVLSEEFLDSFSEYLIQRTENHAASEDSPITILEVGAGNGRLSHFLRQKLEVRSPGKFNVVATDSGEWGLKKPCPVEIIGHCEALKKYKPQIVICSWMPYCKDLTKDFRDTESVSEYILIGETDGGCCGDAWLTWGFSFSFDVSSGTEENTPPYIADGFERKDLKDIGQHQICRSDRLGDYLHSATISFKRITNF